MDGRKLIEARAQRLVQKRERLANEPIAQRILDVLNFRPPEARRRLRGDPQTGMDYETLFECQMELGDLMDSWLEARCRAAQWHETDVRRRVEDDLNRRRLCFMTGENGGLAFSFSGPARNMIDLGLGGGYKADAKPGRTEAVTCPR